MPPSKLSGLSIGQLQHEVRRRERRLHSLHKKRESLAEQIQEIESQILTEGGDLAGLTGRTRPRNEQKLAEALASLLANKTLSVTEAAEQVQSAGYRTTSPNFRTIVNQTLLKDPRFKRVSRGRYTAKGARSTARTSSRRRR